MQSQDKLIEQPTYSMALFRTAIHPEFFEIEDRITVQHNEYDFEAWLIKGCHVLRFEYEGTCVTEVIAPNTDDLPERGHVTSLVCAGERDHEQEFGDRITLINSMQIEILPEHLFGDSYQELTAFGIDAGAKLIEYTTDDGNHGISILDVQRYNDELHVQSYHLHSRNGVVLRTQSIFEIKPVEISD
jgi:hypothetical protein|tara:strand:- start:53 stop:613 length:561 start_codon:yes stop_codon:yes gene_type:complete